MDDVTPGGMVAGLGALAPWGSPPTPLLPRWFREVLALVPLPDELKDSASSVMTVRDLGKLWESRSAPLDKNASRALIGLVGDHRPPPDHVVVPSACDHAILVQYPLRVRTRNGLD